MQSQSLLLKQINVFQYGSDRDFHLVKKYIPLKKKKGEIYIEI